MGLPVVGGGGAEGGRASAETGEPLTLASSSPSATQPSRQLSPAADGQPLAELVRPVCRPARRGLAPLPSAPRARGTYFRLLPICPFSEEGAFRFHLLLLIP